MPTPYDEIFARRQEADPYASILSRRQQDTRPTMSPAQGMPSYLTPGILPSLNRWITGTDEGLTGAIGALPGQATAFGRYLVTPAPHEVLPGLAPGYKPTVPGIVPFLTSTVPENIALGKILSGGPAAEVAATEATSALAQRARARIARPIPVPEVRPPAVQTAAQQNLTEAAAQTGVRAQNIAEVAPAIAQRAQAGSIQLLPPPAPAALSADVERIFTAGNPTAAQRLQQSVARKTQIIRETFGPPSEKLRGAQTPARSSWQSVADDFRRFRDTPSQDVPKQVGQDIIGVVAPLSRPEYTTFNKYIVLRDLAEEAQVAAKQGRRPSIPFGVDPAAITQDLQTVESQLTPQIRDAVIRHDRLKAADVAEFVKRGMGTPEDYRAFHFRHYVQDYDELAGFGGPRGFAQGKLRQPPGTMQPRTGSERSIQTDYIDVVQRERTKLYLDHAVSDFLDKTQGKIDFLPTLTPQERQAAFGQGGRPTRPGQIVDLPNGTRLVTYQLREGNQLYPAYTLDAKIVGDATEKVLTADELQRMVGQAIEKSNKTLAERQAAANLSGADMPMSAGFTAARESLAVGRQRPMMLVDPKIARYLDNFNVGKNGATLLNDAMSATAMWKRSIVDVLGLPFQFRNFMGDLENAAWIGKMSPTAPIGKAAKIAYKDAFGAALTPEEQGILDLARQYRVVGSGFQGGIKTSLRAQPELAHLGSMAQQLGQIPGKALGTYEKVFRAREDVLRLAHFMNNVDRIQNGEAVAVSKAIDVTGLSPLQAAGKAARESIIDYGNRSPFEEAFSKIGVAPFVTWFYQNFRNWKNLAVRDPARTAAAATPYAAMAVWNNTRFPDTEKNLPSYLKMTPHIVTGYTLPDGRMLVLKFSGAAAGAAQATGLGKVFDLSQQVARGEKSVNQAAAESVPGVLMEAGRNAAFQVGPMLTVPLETLAAITSKGQMLPDIRRGQQRVPQALLGTKEGIKQFASQELTQSVVPAAGVVMRQFQPSHGMPPGTSLPAQAALTTGLGQAVDIQAEQGRQLSERIRSEQGKRAEQLYKAEQSYIDTGDFGQAIKTGMDAGANPGDVAKRLTTPRVQIARTRREMQTTNDEEKLQGLTSRLRVLMQIQQQEMMKTAPKSIRPSLLQPQP